MIKIRYGLFQKEIERQHKLRQLFQEIHQVFNTRLLRDKAILKRGIKAGDQLATLEMALNLKSETRATDVYIVEKGSLSYWFLKTFGNKKAIILRPAILDYCSTRYLFHEILDQIYPLGALDKQEMFDIYTSCHINSFGDVYPYSIKNIEPEFNLLGFKRYDWKLSC